MECNWSMCWCFTAVDMTRPMRCVCVCVCVCNVNQHCTADHKKISYLDSVFDETYKSNCWQQLGREEKGILFLKKTSTWKWPQWSFWMASACPNSVHSDFGIWQVFIKPPRVCVSLCVSVRACCNTFTDFSRVFSVSNGSPSSIHNTNRTCNNTHCRE